MSSGYRKSRSKRKVIVINAYINEKILNTQLTTIPQGTKKRRTKPKARRKKIITFRAEINEIETRKKNKKKNQLKSMKLGHLVPQLLSL